MENDSHDSVHLVHCVHDVHQVHKLAAMDKTELRKKYLEARRALSPQDAADRSAAVIERLESLAAFKRARAVLSYVSSKDNEVDTHSLIGRMLNKGRTVLVPIAQPDRAMEWSKLETLDELAPGRFGILEPRMESRRLMAPPPDSIVIVPGVAFTTDGHRIGYGGGYFDRFLASYKGTSIGVAFDLQIMEPIEMLTHDIPVDLVVTESHVYPRSNAVLPPSQSQ